MVKPLGGRQSRDLEQYLTAVLNELRPRGEGQEKGVRYMLERGKQITHLHKNGYRLNVVLYSCTRDGR